MVEIFSLYFLFSILCAICLEKKCFSRSYYEGCEAPKVRCPSEEEDDGDDYDDFYDEDGVSNMKITQRVIKFTNFVQW